MRTPARCTYQYGKLAVKFGSVLEGSEISSPCIIEPDEPLGLPDRGCAPGRGDAGAGDPKIYRVGAAAR